MEVSQTPENRTSIRSINSPAGHIPEENENTHLKGYMYRPPNIHSGSFYNTQDVDATQVSTNK